MNEQNTDEIRSRRQAFKFFELGKSPVEILARIPRSRAWLFKWKRRFEEHGWQALDSLSKAPHHSSHGYQPEVVRLVVQTRRRMEKSTVGLISARALQQELLRQRLLTTAPSQTTIKRWLRQAGVLGESQTVAGEVYYPALPPQSEAVTFSCDWISRYLTGGEKVFVFHTLDLQTRALAQTIRTDKSTDSACDHLLRACVEIGLPDFLRLDNDAAFTGLGRHGRQFGQFVRTALHLGIELLFIPPGEAKRNHDVERVNGLWAGSFWDKDHFSSRSQLLRKSPKFLTWYQTYAPPALNGLTVGEATREYPRHHLQERQMAELPNELPLTAGRLHFVRRVSAGGEIQILKEPWKVSRSLAGQYVLATLDLRRQELLIYHRRSTRADAHLIRQYEYEIDEPIKPLLPEYRRRARRPDMLTII
jgi:transposase